MSGPSPRKIEDSTIHDRPASGIENPTGPVGRVLRQRKIQGFWRFDAQIFGRSKDCLSEFGKT